MPSNPRNSSGTFGDDFDWLIKQLDRPAIIELGKPEPEGRFLPRNAGSCHASHNRLLLGDVLSGE